MRRALLVLGLVVSSFSLIACGGGGKEANSAETTKADLSPMEELKAIPNDLNTDITGLTKPIDDTQAVIDRITGIPKKYGISAADLTTMAKATLTDGKVQVNVDTNVAAEAKAEIEAALKQLSEIVVALKATPDKAAALTKKIATLTAKVPVLATKVSTSASATTANPFASKDDKAKAQADAQSVQQVQQDVQKSVSEAQQKVAGIPALAATALGKLTASIAGGT
jgi:hypothetical protein